jgi:hypothetical protein
MINTVDHRAVPIDANDPNAHVKLVKNIHLNVIMNIQYINIQHVARVKNATIAIIHYANIRINQPRIVIVIITMIMMNRTKTFKIL